MFVPELNLMLDACVDSNFAGTWTPETADKRNLCLSRTGYMIAHCNCPILWKSMSQSKIALSMTEAEHMASSALMRELVPMRTVVSELATDGPISDLKINGIKATTDNFETPTDPDQLKEGMFDKLVAVLRARKTRYSN